MTYYDTHAEEYYQTTSAPMPDSYYRDFLTLIPPACRILDLGCGSGRDLKYFAEKGYNAEGLDISPSMCEYAHQHSGQPVNCGDCRSWLPNEKYDAVWACASLLHLDEADLLAFFSHLPLLLVRGGIMYASFKRGIHTGNDEKGRYFTNFSEDLEKQILMVNRNITIVNRFVSQDSFGRNGFSWINLYYSIT